MKCTKLLVDSFEPKRKQINFYPALPSHQRTRFFAGLSESPVLFEHFFFDD